MNHYPNFTQAVDKWNERKQRINWNNLFLMTLTDDKKVAEKFDSLPYTKKVIFTSFPSDIPSAMYLDVYNSPRYTGRQFWEAVVELAWGTITYYDIWDLLLYGFDQKSHNCIIR